MAGNFIEQLLNFIIPPAVFLFIGFIFYRIPLVHDGIDRLREWNSNRQSRMDQPESTTIRSITYE
jgi:hypothetical protein